MATALGLVTHQRHTGRDLQALRGEQRTDALAQLELPVAGVVATEVAGLLHNVEH